MRTIKAPITQRALIARINRRLAKDDMILKAARGERMRQAVGDYYVVNVRINGVLQRYKDCDPVEVARELGVLKEWETVR
jgi:hypothetical protein